MQIAAQVRTTAGIADTHHRGITTWHRILTADMLRHATTLLLAPTLRLLVPTPLRAAPVAAITVGAVPADPTVVVAAEAAVMLEAAEATEAVGDITNQN